MPRKTIEQIRAELDELNAKMAKKQHVTDNLLIAKASPKYREKLSKSLKGKSKTKEHIENRKKAMSPLTGENNPFYGKTHSNETKLKISQARLGKPPTNKGSSHTIESLMKMRKPRSEEGKLNMRGHREQKICPHCGLVGAGGNMGRYHFDNCKHKK